MKSYALIFAFIITGIFTGCKKDKVTKATNISNQQAATMVATALAVNAYGLVSVKNDVTLYAKNLGTTAGRGCGVIDSFAVARQEPTTSLVKYNYALGYHFMVNCDGAVPNTLTSNTTYHGSFDAATLSSINTANCMMDVVNLGDATAANYLLTATYQSSGTFEAIDETQLTGNDMIIIGTDGLKIKKSDRSIVGGNAAVNVTGSVKNKNTFSFSGNLTFDNTGIARLVLDGVAYNINLITAETTAL